MCVVMVTYGLDEPKIGFAESFVENFRQKCMMKQNEVSYSLPISFISSHHTPTYTQFPFKLNCCRYVTIQWVNK